MATGSTAMLRRAAQNVFMSGCLKLYKNREGVSRTTYQEPNEGCRLLRARRERPRSRCAAKNR
jgi:hypothetical protein